MSRYILTRMQRCHTLKKIKTTFEDFSVATAALKTNPTVFDFKCQSALREVDRGTPTSAYKYE